MRRIRTRYTVVLKARLDLDGALEDHEDHLMSLEEDLRLRAEGVPGLQSVTVESEHEESWTEIEEEA